MNAVRILFVTVAILSAVTASPNPTSPITEHVSWTGLLNAAASGTSLKKTAGCDGCEDSWARSLQNIPSGDGYVEFRAASSGLVVGLTRPSSAKIDFALVVKPGSYAAVYESGAWSADSFPAMSGENDVYRIALVGERVHYSLNGTVFYTSTKIATYPLFVAADLMGLSSSVNNAVINHITSKRPDTTPHSAFALSTSAYAIPVPTSTGTPDPTLLPVATTTQTPQTSAYNALNVPGLAAGSSYLDPLTGVKVYKLTSSVFPATGSNWGHDYAEGGNEVSLPLNSSGTRAVLVFTGSDHWLIDFTPGVGVSNARNLSGSPFQPFLDGCVSFSSNSATPYYMYVSSGATIHRVDVRTMTEAPGGGWPVTGETEATWLHQNENDTFFTWMRGANGSTIVGYEPASGVKKTYTNSGLNEPRIDRDTNNRSVCVSMSTPQNQALFWDWRNNVITWSSPLWPGTSSGEPPVAHQASMRGYWVGVDWNLSYPWQFFKISATPNSIVNPLPGGTAQGGGHCDGNWIQHPANADDQWYACYYYGALMPPSNDPALGPGGILLSTATGQRRILAHLYNTSTVYTFYSFAKLSSDGNYVLFTSDMNGSARSDLFLAEMPTGGAAPPPPDTTPPTVAITAPSNGATVSGTITVSANASDNVGVVGVQFLLDGANLGAEDMSAPYATTWNTTTASTGSHTLTAVARDAAGNHNTSAPVTVTVADTTPPTVPTGLTATPVSSSQINLSWNASTDTQSGVAGYKIYRGGTQIGTSVTPSYSDTGLSPSTTYTYTVSAYDNAGNNSAQCPPVSATTLASAPPPPPPPPSGMIAFLHLDENAGSTVFSDATGSGNSGSCAGTGCPTAGVPGKVNRALSFDGLSDFVTITHKSSLNAFPLTVETWFKTSSTTGVVGLVNKYVAGSYNGYNVFLNNGNVCAWYLRDASNYAYDGSGCTFNIAGFNNNAWHQVVYVVDSSGGKLYLDGVQKGTTQAWTGVAGSTTTTQDIHLGHYPGAFGGVEYFKGLLDEVRIYNTALTASDVSALYAADNAPPPDTTPPTVPTGLTATPVSSSQINLSWTASTDTQSGMAGYRIYRGGTQIGTSVTPSYASTGLSPSTTYMYTVSAYDNAGNNSAQCPSVSATTLAPPPSDTTPPTVAMSAPSNGATVSGAVQVSASASDNVGVVGVQFYLDSAALGAEVLVAPYSVTWDSTATSNGTHTLTARARDAAGNSNTSAGVQVTVSNSIPASPPPPTGSTVTITNPIGGSTVSGVVEVDASVSNLAAVGVRFYLDGSALGLEDNFAPWAVSWDTTQTPNGSHTLTAVARDLSGTVITSAPVTVTVLNGSLRKRPHH